MSFTTLSLLSGLLGKCILGKLPKKTTFCFVHREEPVHRFVEELREKSESFWQTFLEVESRSSHTCRPDKEEEEESAGRIPSPSV